MEQGAEEEHAQGPLPLPPLQVHQGEGIHGLYLMGIFLACGLLMTLGWGGITTVLVLVVRAGCGSSVMCDNLSHM